MIHANAAVMKPKMAVPLRSRMGWSVFRESATKYTVLARTNKKRDDGDTSERSIARPSELSPRAVIVHA